MGISEAETLRLGDADRAAMADEAFEIHCRIFEGVDRATFVKHIVEPDARTCRLRIYRDEAGAAVAYASLHELRVTFEGRQIAVLRGACGALPEWRGRTLFGPYFARLFIRAWLTNIGRETVIFASPVSPRMFVATDRTMARYWTLADPTTPPDRQRLIRALADRCGLPGEGPARRVGWRVKGADAASARPEAGEMDPAEAFFRTHNPRFAEGFGLLTLCPMHLVNVRSGLTRTVRTRLRRRR